MQWYLSSNFWFYLQIYCFKMFALSPSSSPLTRYSNFFLARGPNWTEGGAGVNFLPSHWLRLLTYCHLPALLLVQSGWLSGKNTMRRQSVDHLGLEDIRYQINLHSSFHIICFYFTCKVIQCTFLSPCTQESILSAIIEWKMSWDFFFSTITLFLSILFAFVVFPFKCTLSVCLIHIVFLAFSFDLCKLLDSIFHFAQVFHNILPLLYFPPELPVASSSRWGSSDNL